MSTNKKNSFTSEEVELADFAKALSHPARVVILRVLAEKNRCICGEIVDFLPLAQSTVSQHLKELKRVGLIKGEIDGPRSCYCIDWERFRKLNLLMKELQDTMDTTAGPCCGTKETL